MPAHILVVGGTGTLGRVVVQRLTDKGARVRVPSRGRRPSGPGEHVVGDVRTGEGLAEAITGMDTVVCCVDPVHRVVEAALAAGRPHLVYISIVGIDQIPLSYYRRKLADEQRIATSGLGWSLLRATQFHDLVAAMLRIAAKPPVMMLPAGWSFQPVDVRDVGPRVACLALGEPAGRVPDLGGPEVFPLDALGRRYLAAMEKHRPILSVPLPGRIARAYRTGAHLASDQAVGTIPFESYLAEQLAAGNVPYRDAIRSYTQCWPLREVR